MKSIILKENGENQLPVYPYLPAGYDVTVALDKRAEYSRVLPLLANFLIGQFVDADGAEDFAAMDRAEGRLKELEAFRQNVEGVPYDANRSFLLSAEEAEIAPVLLLQAELPGPYDSAEMGRRFQMASDIMRCLGKGWAQVTAEAA